MGKRQSNDKEDILAFRHKWNVPDWSKPEEYNYVKHLSREQVRWEFLRRDKKYRQLSERSLKPRAHFFLGKYILPNIKGDELPKDFRFADSIRRGEGLALNPPPISTLLFKKGEPDPQAPGGILDAYLGAQLNALWEEGYVIIAFDPFRPFHKQKKAAEERYKQSRDKIKRETPKALINGSKRTIVLKDAQKLLRVLDASNEGLSFKDIGKTIYKVQDYSDAGATGKQHVKRALTYWRTL